jgi:hypothetical protein
MATFSLASSRLSSAAAAAFTLCGLSLLVGCGLGTIARPAPANSSTTISGRIHGGEQPISGATVDLWETGTTGYGTGATQLVASTTSAITTGTFTFPTANVPANCTGGPFAYITASGGDPTGRTLTNQNHAVLMVAVLGSCSGTGASTFVDIDEVTTVAAAYALSGFSTVSGAAGSLASLNIGAPATNARGLADAVANATLLVNTGLGTSNPSTATVELPSVAINSLANSIAACTNATEYNVAPCTTVFSLATPPGGTQPTNIFQALLNIAHYPGQNVTALLHMATPDAPFFPVLAGGSTSSTSTSVLNDFTLGIAYPNATLAAASTGPVGLAIDNTDNVWTVGAGNGTSGSTYNYIGELPSASSGGPYTATLGSNSALNGNRTVRTAAFDLLGNFWLSDKAKSTGGLIEIAAGAAISSATENLFSTLSSGGLDPNDWAVAIDGAGNPWTASYGGQGNCSTTQSGNLCDYVEFVKSGAAYAATDLFPSATAQTPTVRGIAADAVSSSLGYGNIWTANYGNFSGTAVGGTTIEVLTPSTGVLATITIGSTADAPYGIALDSTGGAYVTTEETGSSALYYVPQGTADGSTIPSTVSTSGTATTLADIPNTITAPASSATTPVPLGGFNNPGYLAVDGAGNIFVGNNNYGTIVEYSPTLSGYLSPYYGFAPSIATVATPTNQALFTCTDTDSVTTCAIAGLANKHSLIPLAIDRAGSVWSMDSAGTLLEIIGTAAPTNPILAAGQSGTLP